MSTPDIPPSIPSNQGASSAPGPSTQGKSSGGGNAEAAIMAMFLQQMQMIINSQTSDNDGNKDLKKAIEGN